MKARNLFATSSLVCRGLGGKTNLSVPIELVKFEKRSENNGRADYVIKRKGSKWATKYTERSGSGFRQFKTHIQELGADHFDEKATKVESHIMQDTNSDDSSN